MEQWHNWARHWGLEPNKQAAKGKARAYGTTRQLTTIAYLIVGKLTRLSAFPLPVLRDKLRRSGRGRIARTAEPNYNRLVFKDLRSGRLEAEIKSGKLLPHTKHRTAGKMQNARREIGTAAPRWLSDEHRLLLASGGTSFGRRNARLKAIFTDRWPGVGC